MDPLIIPCPACDGQGFVLCTVSGEVIPRPCRSCNGTGNLELCPHCILSPVGNVCMCAFAWS